MKSEELKKIVKDKYSGIVVDRDELKMSSCCSGCASCGSDSQGFNLDYSGQPGYYDKADYKLGCGIPTEYARIKPGDHVLDLGSGAGNDCFVARAFTGEHGQVTGIDFTEAMIEKARDNAKKLGYDNVHFILGDIENMPVEKDSYDVVISNCVLNLVPDKKLAYQEIYRILKPGGHFCISDVVLSGILPDKILKAAEMYAGCVSGAMQKEKYLSIIESVGFKQIEVKTISETPVDESTLAEYLNESERIDFKNSTNGIFSITVTAQK